MQLDITYSYSYIPDAVGLGVYITFHPSDPALGNSSYFGHIVTYSGYIAAVADYPNNKFTSHQEMANYYNASAMPILLGIYNTDYAGYITFTAGNFIPVPSNVYSYSQPKSSNLDFISGITMSTDVKSMLQQPNMAAMKSTMAIQASDISGLTASINSQVSPGLDGKVDKVAGKGLSTNDYTNAEKAKLTGIATAATANDTDANLKNRANHTGTQASTTISDFAPASRAAAILYDGTTQRLGVFPAAFTGTVASGNLVVNLTQDGTPSGTAIFPGGQVYLKTLCLRAEEGTNPHAFGVPALSNSNKTLTVPISKVAPVLGILNVGVAANGSVITGLVYGS